MLVYEKINFFSLFRVIENYGRRYEKHKSKYLFYLFLLVSFLLKTEADSLASVMCKVLNTNWLI